MATYQDTMHPDVSARQANPRSAESSSERGPIKTSAGRLIGSLLPSSAYEFPESFPREELRELSNDNLVTMLHVLAEERHPETNLRMPYDHIRPRACAVNMELTERGAIAPRFRPSRKPTRRTGLTLDEHHLSNDRQVLDLYWMHCRRIPVRTSNMHYKRLLTGPQFDFKLASQLIAKTGGSVQKNEILQLREPEQWQLATIQSSIIRDRWRALVDQRWGVWMKLAKIAGRYSWLTDELMEEWVTVSTCAAITGGSPTRMATFYELMTGKRLDPSSLSRKRDRVEKWLEQE